MRFHTSDNYKTYVILIYYDLGYYKAIICNSNNECETLLSHHLTCYEALTYAKKRIDTK